MKYFVYCRKSTESEDRQVLSLASQETELQNAFASRPEVEIVDVLREAFSAKAPGRPVFRRMIERIERGEADGIVAWHPDRLSRNSVDGGWIIYLLDLGKIKDLKFATFTFENNADGKLMLANKLSYSKYFVDNLSENVKRGNRAKLKLGWRPNFVPVGYLNDVATKTIVRDPERFPLVRKLFDLARTGEYSLRRLAIEAKSWGLRTKQFKRRGGNYLWPSSVDHILRNRFYAGDIEWNGQRYSGAHEPMVTLEEFEQVKKQRGRLGKLPPKKRVFAFRGLMRCGECGQRVTPEFKLNRYGSPYTYYHCPKRRYERGICSQRSINSNALNKAFLEFLSERSIPERLHQWAIEQVKNSTQGNTIDREHQKRSLQHALDGTGRALENLTSLRIKDLIGDEEFIEKRKTLLDEKGRIGERLVDLERSDEVFEPAEKVITFSCRAIFWYEAADEETKWQIARATCSNLTLKEKKVSIEAAEPFTLPLKKSLRPSLHRALDRIRTLYNERDPEFMRTLAIIRQLEEKFGKLDHPKPAQ